MTTTRLRDHAILIVGTVFMAAPLVLVFIGAGKPAGLRGSWQPWGGYFVGLIENAERLAVLTGSETTISAMIGTSLAIASGVALVTTVVSFLAAYALTFATTRLSRIVFAVTLATLYFPIEARMLPTFDVTLSLGLINSLPGLILPILPIAVATFVFRQHFLTLPTDVREAAQLDGAGPLRYLRDFVIPLSQAPIFAVLLVTFLVGWNQYLWPLMVSTDNSYFPVMRGLNLTSTGSGPSMLLGAVSLLPPLVLVLAFGRALTRMAGLRA